MKACIFVVIVGCINCGHNSTSTKINSEPRKEIGKVETRNKFSEDTVSTRKIIEVSDSLLKSRQNVLVFVQLSNGEIRQVKDFNNWPTNIAKIFNTVQSNGNVLLLKEIPYSESGDSNIEYDYFFSNTGKTVAFRVTASFFDSDCSEEALHETLLRFYNDNFEVIAANYIIRDSSKREIKATECSSINTSHNVYKSFAETSIYKILN